MVESRESCSVAYCETPEEFDAHGPGALTVDEEVLTGEDYPAMFIYLRLPNGEDAGALQVTRDPGRRNERRVWHITGNPRKPETLSLAPSIHLVGSWHGHLDNGRLVSC